MSRAARAALSLLLALIACEPRSGDDTHPEALELQQLEELSAIGYLAASDPAGAASGVTLHDSRRAAPGLNLYTSGHAPVAVLMDMQGRVLHEWHASFDELFPERARARQGKPPPRNFWRVARLLPDGELLAIWDLYGIFKLDRDSRVVWVVPTTAHHDLHVAADGRIHHLEARRRPLPEIPEGPATDDFIVVRDAAGTELRRIAVSDALRNADWVGLRKLFWLRSIARGYGLGERSRLDPFHTNALWILSGQEAAHLGNGSEAGDALVSMAMLDTIAVIDMEQGRARWWQQGPFGMQHQPRPTPDGNIVLFNNHEAPDRSSVQILDPRTRRVTWEYDGSDADPLFSRRSGGTQMLPGGNVLIVETDRGRALEVTPSGESVWEFRNPFRGGEEGDRVAHLYSLQRIPELQLEWLTWPEPGS